MPKVDLKLYSLGTQDGKKITSTVNYVNPDANNTVLKTFAQQLNSLTTNVYDSTDRVETMNVDTESSRKQFRNTTITGATRGGTATITMNCADGESFNPVAMYMTGSSPYTLTYLTLTRTDSGSTTVLKFTTTIPNEHGGIYVGITEKDEFYADFTRVAVE